MATYSIVQVNCVGRQRVPLPIECYRLQIWPNGHVNHITYGLFLVSAWQMVRHNTGMLWIEGDIAITPEHLDEIDRIVAINSRIVVSVPYLLYPKTTGRNEPCWSNRGITKDGTPIYYRSEDGSPEIPAFFSLGCTFLPERLLDGIVLQSANWDYPCLDTRLSELARERGIPCVATHTPCLHLHY